MAQNGWERLGSALAGMSDGRREEIRQKTINGLAQADYNIARARGEVLTQRERESLGRRLADLGFDNSDAAAGVLNSGVNLRNYTAGMGDLQEQRFRQGAVDAAASGDWGGGNAQLLGVANGPVALPTVQGGMLISNRLVPGGGEVSATDVGQSQIDRNNAQGRAALIRASRVGGGGGGGGPAPKMSEVDKLRLKAAMDDLTPMIAAARNEIIANQGGSSEAAQRRVAAAQTRLAELQRQRDEIINTFGGGAPTPPAPTEWTSTATGTTRPLQPGYSGDLMEQLTGINRDRLSRGEPALTGEQAGEYRRTGTVRAGSGSGPVRVTSKAQMDALPSGTTFIAPDGSVRRKP